MSRARVLVVAVLSMAAIFSVAGCGADIPAQPTWAEDVYPIMVARCVRCHNAAKQGEPGADTKPAIGNFDHPDFASLMSDNAVVIVSMLGVMDIKKGASNPMPKPPAAPLADWQVETITRWAKNPQ